jgi:predicted ferric reductase
MTTIMNTPAATRQLPTALRRRQRLTAGPAMTAIWLGAAAVLLLWWHDTVFINGFGDWLTNAGRLTGLLAGYVIIVLLALMARVPALERGVGTDRLARWHASLGRYTVCLAVAHALLILWGYAVTAHQNVVAETGSLLLSYPDVLMATVALGLLVTTGIVSARAARRRMSYETWHFLHLYTYLAVALAFSHQFATGADFATDLRARVLWSALYLTVGATLLWFRVVNPIVQGIRHRLHVVAIHRESPDTVSIWITGRRLDELAVEAGQFFRWRFLTRGLWGAANPYSLSAAADANYLRITVKNLGGHSRALQDVAVGTRVLAEGPFGAFTAGRRRNRKVLLLAGGLGITPIRALFESLPGSPGEITLIYRASTPTSVVFAAELEAIARHRGARLFYLYSPARAPRSSARVSDPLTTRELTQMVPDLFLHDVYLCGPPGMTEHARTQLRSAGVPRRQIHTESFEF